jgi:hypothetical protein
MLPSGLPDLVSDEEDLARFLTSSRQFNATMVKPSAFLPRNGKKSVFRHGAEPLDSLIEIARDQISPDQTVHGAAICKAFVVRAARLDVVAEEPPPRHADVVGWPTNADPESQKAEQMERAAIIAGKCSLLRFGSK